MKKEISEKVVRDFNKVRNIYNVLFGLLILTPMSLLYFFDKIGMVIWAISAVIFSFGIMYLITKFF